jgi:radical SAM superfamily enzyme YgiQ (UPF0313 family)
MEKLASEYGVKVFKIIDENFILRPSHYLEIADRIIERGLGDHINAWAYARVDTIKDENLERLRKAGIKWLALGFESGNAEILREAHKGNFDRDDMMKVREKLKSADINVMGNYMFGFPSDTEHTMQETLDMAVEQNCEFANFYSAIAWPGSELYDRSVREGKRLPEGWHNYAQHAYGFVPLPTKFLSAEQVLAFRDKSFTEYFSGQRYLDTVEKRFGVAARAHIEEMNKIKIKRKILEPSFK